MAKIQPSVRNIFLAGVFAALPVAITIFLIVKINEWTAILSIAVFDRVIPFAGVVIALILIYLTGFVVTHSVGKFFLRAADRVLVKIPLLRPLYESWKQISFTPGGGEGMFARVVLIPDESGQMRMLGFTSGDPLPGDPNAIVVFAPNAPNPIQGRLYLVAREKVIFTPLSSEEAFKILLSNGNYVPREVKIIHPG